MTMQAEETNEWHSEADDIARTIATMAARKMEKRKFSPNSSVLGGEVTGSSGHQRVVVVSTVGGYFNLQTRFENSKGVATLSGFNMNDEELRFEVALSSKQVEELNEEYGVEVENA